MPDVTITAPGVSTTVPVPEGASLEVALTEAGVDAQGSGLSVSVNGANVSEPQQREVQNGDQVVVSPSNVKLG